MKSAFRIGEAVLATLLLSLPALWNGFPLLQFDTGGYFARWYEGTLEESRSTVYGLFLNIFAWPDFWPAVAVQSVLTVWILSIVLRVHGLGAPVLIIVTVAILSVGTALPWLASQLITDVFCGLAVLALYLLVMRTGALKPLERIALFVFVSFAAATHNATLAVLVALVVAGLVFALFNSRRLSFAALARGGLALAFAAVLLIAANYVVAKNLAWTPGGIALTFGRMLNDGIVKRYLAEHCPDVRFKLCDHIAELPDDADVFFWGEGLFNRLGRFQGMNDEMRTIVLESFAAYPWLQIETAAIATLRQLVMVKTGYGVNTEIWHTYGMIENFAPTMHSDMKAARQQQNELDFAAINLVHVPVALISMVLLLGVIPFGLLRKDFADLGALATVVVLAFLANAFVCGALSNPHDRYGARIVWLGPLLLLMMLFRARRSASTVALSAQGGTKATAVCIL